VARRYGQESEDSSDNYSGRAAGPPNRLISTLRKNYEQQRLSEMSSDMDVRFMHSLFMITVAGWPVQSSGVDAVLLPDEQAEKLFGTEAAGAEAEQRQRPRCSRDAAAAHIAVALRRPHGTTLVIAREEEEEVLLCRSLWHLVFDGIFSLSFSRKLPPGSTRRVNRRPYLLPKRSLSLAVQWAVCLCV